MAFWFVTKLSALCFLSNWHSFLSRLNFKIIISTTFSSAPSILLSQYLLSNPILGSVNHHPTLLHSNTGLLSTAREKSHNHIYSFYLQIFLTHSRCQHCAGYEFGATTNFQSLISAGPSYLITLCPSPHLWSPPSTPILLNNFPNLPHAHSDFTFCFSQRLSYEGWMISISHFLPTNTDTYNSSPRQPRLRCLLQFKANPSTCADCSPPTSWDLNSPNHAPLFNLCLSLLVLPPW